MGEQLKYCPVAWQAALNPDLSAIKTDTHSMSFAELHYHVSSLSQQLLKKTMKKADRLACIAPNGLQLIILQLACIRQGFIFCPINAKFSQLEIKQRLDILETDFVWDQDATHNTLSLNFEFPLRKPLIKDKVEIESFLINPLDVVSIIFTSGSSGSPKAVMHHFSNHYYSALGSQTVIPLLVGDKNLLSLPMFHISGYATVIRTLIAGATLQLINQKITTKILLETQITHLSLVCSQLIQLLADKNFKSNKLAIKHLLLGGSSFPSKCLQQTAQRGFTYHLSYGSTEMASQIATSTNSEVLNLLPYRAVKIQDQEILLAGKTRFVGYFQNQLIGSHKYFASADLGELNAQTLKIIGRKDRQFISGGENVQPEEIEKVLLTFTGISQAYVLPIQDNLYGQRPVAFIKWANEEKIIQLEAFIKDKLIHYKRPLHYFTFPPQQGIKPDVKKLKSYIDKLLKEKQSKTK